MVLMTEPGNSRRSDTEIRTVAHQTLSVPLLRLLQAKLIDEDDPSVGTVITVDENALNAVGSLHAGAIAMLLEVTAYLSLLPDLARDEEAATHAFSASYIRGGRLADELRCTATVTHRSGRLAFVSAELTRDSDLVAMAMVTKSILRSSS
jgi:uncharacterized protein (TIGR00369 family)